MLIKAATTFLLLCCAFSCGFAQTPLLDAIKENDLENVKQIIADNADVNQLDKDGATPLMWAVYKADLNMVKYLVENGADPLLKKGVIFTDTLGRYYGNLTGIAAGEGKLDILKYLVEDLNIDVNDREFNLETGSLEIYPAISKAYDHENIEIIKYLRGVNADTSFLNDYNYHKSKFEFFFKIKQFEKAKMYILDAKQIAIYSFGHNSPQHLTALEIITKNIYDLSLETDLYFKELLSIKKELFGEEHIKYSYSLSDYAMTLYGDSSIQLLKQVVEIQKEYLVTNFDDYQGSIFMLCLILNLEDRKLDALKVYQESASIIQEIFGDYSPFYVKTLTDITQQYIQLERLDEALACVDKIRKIVQDSFFIKNDVFWEDVSPWENKAHWKDKEMNNLLFADNLAVGLINIGLHKEAKKIYFKLVEVRKKYIANKPSKYSESLIDLAQIYIKLCFFDKVEPLILEALEINKNLHSEKHESYILALFELAKFYLKIGNYKEAEYTISKVLKNSPESRYKIWFDNLLAKIYTVTGKYKEAEKVYWQVLDLELETKSGYSISIYTPDVYTNISRIKYKIGNFEEGRLLLLQAIDSLEKSNYIDNISYAKTLDCLGNLEEADGNIIKAKNLYQKSILAIERTLDANSFNSEIYKVDLARVFLKERKLDSAAIFINPAIENLNNIFGDTHILYLYALDVKSQLLMAKRDINGSQLLVEEILTKRLKLFGSQHPDYAITLSRLADIHNANQEFKKAEEAYLKAKEVLSVIIKKQHPDYLKILNSLALLYQNTFQYDKAATIYQELQQISNDVLKRGSQVNEENLEEISNSPLATRRDQEVSVNPAPFIGIYTPDPLLKNERGVTRLNASNFTIKGFVHAAYGIKDLYINEDTIEITPSGVWQYPVTLKEGINHFYIKAEAYSSDIAYDTLQLSYENDEGELDLTTKKYLLAIGIDDYNYENWNRLKMPTKDSRDLVNTLTERYAIDQVDTLFNATASFANVRSKLKELIGKTQSNDEVIIFFAGHGEYDAGYDEDGKWILANGRLGNASLATIIEKMKAKHVLVLADACFAGSFYLKRGDNATEQRNKNKSRWVMASGRLETVADKMVGQDNSPFAYHLIDYLQKANSDVSIYELKNHLETEVPKVTNQQPVAGPVKGDEGGEFIFRIKE